MWPFSTIRRLRERIDYLQDRLKSRRERIVELDNIVWNLRDQNAALRAQLDERTWRKAKRDVHVGKHLHHISATGRKPESTRTVEMPSTRDDSLLLGMAIALGVSTSDSTSSSSNDSSYSGNGGDSGGAGASSDF